MSAQIKMQFDAEQFRKIMSDFHEGIGDGRITKSMGEDFVKFTKNQLMENGLSLAPNSGATKKIQQAEHNPLSFTGGLAGSMESRMNADKSCSAGFFGDNTTKPEGSKLTYTQIAILQSSGFRIPLTGEKGDRVRGWLAAHGIYVRKDKESIEVPARPFLTKAFEIFEVQESTSEVMSKAFNEAMGA